MTIVAEHEPQLFYDRHEGALAEIFDRVGLPDAAMDSLDVAVELTQPWVKGDHSRPENRVDVRPEDSERLHVLYGTMGMKNEVVLPPGDYYDITLLGAVQRGNRRRTELLSRMVTDGGVNPDRVSLLGGQRYLFPEVEKADIETTLAVIEAKGRHTDWSRHIENMDVGNMWETDAMRLAAMEHLGKLVLQRIDLRANDRSIHEVADPILGYEFTWDDVPLTLMHTLAIERPNGERRHTTEACMLDWLDRRQPPEKAKIGFIGANPHVERMGRAASAVLRNAGRGDLQLVVAGSAAPDGLGHGHFLGEIARNLYEDRRALAA